MKHSSNTAIKYNDAAAYDEMMGAWSQLLGSKFIDWIGPSQNKKWIDIGCGSGAFTEQIFERCAPVNIAGIDPSNEQIEFASNRFSSDILSFQVADAMDLPFEENSFDFATMALVLFFVPEPLQGVREMARVVKPGGSISAYVWDVYGGGLPVEIIHSGLRKMNIDYPIPPSAEVSKIENLNDLWSLTGISNIESKQISVSRTFASFEELWNITLKSPALQPVLNRINKHDLSELKQNVKYSLVMNENQSVTYSAHANAIKGTV
jgi:ubiquinone/menaquinone biosynthesis C-methylase UbiE